MKIPFYIVDVFAEQKYEGNQLAVFRNAEKLSGEQMLQIAREINFQESAFILSDVIKNGGYDVRIFTPEYEIPFARHPILGTAFVIENFVANASINPIILNLKIDNIHVSTHDELFWLEVSNPVFTKIFDAKEITKLLGINVNHIEKSLPLQVVSIGLPYLIIPIKKLETMKKMKLNEAKIKSWLIEQKLYKTNSDDGLSVSFFPFTRQTYDRNNQLNARMFCYENDKIIEDAATGSANACLLAYLLKYNEGTIKLKVEQGYEIQRKSLIYLDGQLIDNQHFKLRIGGKVKAISQGEWII
jgi:trans-2,3-dihydro-3-hydroxyanthranilate isomerase